MAEDSVDTHVGSLLKMAEDVASQLEEEHLALKTIVEGEFSALLQAVVQRKQAVLEAIDKDKQARLAQVEEFVDQCKEVKDGHSNLAVDGPTASQLVLKPLPLTKYGVLVGTWSVIDAIPCVRVLPAQKYTVDTELPVQVLGGVSTTGKFVVRVVQPPGVQEACLRDVSDMISYDLGREPTPPISEPRPGDLCCARYHDNKWYRARVESIPQSGKVKVFLVDFGSILHTSTNELIPLKEKYRQYPFQVLLCALSEESITLPREAKWKFGDEIRSWSVTMNIIKELNHGYEYVVSLWTQSPQPVNISEAVLQLANVKEAQHEAHPILHRDVRLKDAPPTSGTSSKEAPPPKQVDMVTGSMVGVKRIDLDLKGVTVLQRPKPKPNALEPNPDAQELKPEVQEPKPDVQEPKPDVQEPKPDVQEPKPDVQEPKPDVQEPKPDVQEPKPDVQEPKPDVQEPKPDVQEPKPDVQEPKPDLQEPKPDVQEPKPDVQGPKPDLQEPKTDAQEPETDVQEPKPDLQEPKPDLQEPIPNLQDGKPDLQDSDLKPGEVETAAEVPENSHSNATPENGEMCPNLSANSLPQNKPVVGGEKDVPLVTASKQPQPVSRAALSVNDRNGDRSKADVHQADVWQQKGKIDLHPSVREGHQVSLVVVSELSSRGEFWAQVAIVEEEEEEKYNTMAEELQISVQNYFHLNQLQWPRGSTCAARFTEDKIWYRAQVESVSCDSHVTVRYIDFGNAEEIPVKYIRPLEASFWRLPCHAVKCSILLEEDRQITSKMCQKFNKLTQNSEEDPVNAKVVAVGTDVVHVQLLWKVEGRDPIDLNEEVLLSDLNAVGALEFTLTPVEQPPGLGSWADRMDELNSPSALMPEVSFESHQAATGDNSKERLPQDWLSTQDEKGAIRESQSFGKKQSAHSSRAGSVRLFQNSLRGVHVSDEEVSRERGTSPSTASCGGVEKVKLGRVEGVKAYKEQRHHASNPSLAGSENWDEEDDEQVGAWKGGQGHAHPRADSPWDGSQVKLFVGGLCSGVLPQQVINLFEPQLKVHNVIRTRSTSFLVKVDRDGYEAKVRELNGKVVPGVTHGDKGLVVEKSRKKKPERDGRRQRRT